MSFLVPYHNMLDLINTFHHIRVPLNIGKSLIIWLLVLQWHGLYGKSSFSISVRVRDDSEQKNLFLDAVKLVIWKPPFSYRILWHFLRPSRKIGEQKEWAKIKGL